jgi:hypothetical protein
VNPGADKLCNGIDDDCDGTIDVGAVDAPTWYADTDTDGYGDPDAGTAACSAPADTVADNTDCNDGDAAYHPGASEDDCTDPNDYNCDGSVGYADVDGDGVAACEDCDDSDKTAYPGADETCDDVDNDCDGSIDEEAIDPATFYLDADSDGYGIDSTTATGCDAPSGYAADNGDCNDDDDTIFPGADETCNSTDDDCDGSVDEDAVDGTTYYVDFDEDGFGGTSSTVVSCDDAPSGYVADDTDCNDLDSDTNPDATEECDFVDNDCDGSTDEDCAEICDDSFDNDGDSLVDCDDDDCATECPEPDCTDGVDNDSDGLTDCEDPDCVDDTACIETDCSDGVDDDGDGLTDCEDGDCADDPACVEDCTDTIDNDLDGLIDCDDDDCWGLDCHTDGVVSTVQGGDVFTRSDDMKQIRNGCYGTTSAWDSSRQEAKAFMNDVWGTVAVVPAGQKWSTATTSTTCQWSFALGTFESRKNHWASPYGYSSSYVSADDVWRKNVNVEDGCRLAGDDWLPQQLLAQGDGTARVHPTAELWYDGTATSTSSAFSRVYTYACYYGTGIGSWGTEVTRRSFDLELTTGETYHAK